MWEAMSKKEQGDDIQYFLELFLGDNFAKKSNIFSSGPVGKPIFFSQVDSRCNMPRRGSGSDRPAEIENYRLPTILLDTATLKPQILQEDFDETMQ